MGTLRFVLAFSVVYKHLGEFAFIHLIDPGIAVKVFFILSGFYMSLVLDKKYSSRKLLHVFYVNRFLRIWIPYAVSMILILIIFARNGQFQSNYQLLSDFSGLSVLLIAVANFSAIGLNTFYNLNITENHLELANQANQVDIPGYYFIFNMPAWTLSVEIVFYLFAPFVVKTFSRTLFFTLFGVIYFQFINHISLDDYSDYRLDLMFPYFICFFGFGSISYFLQLKKQRCSKFEKILLITIFSIYFQSSLEIEKFVYLIAIFAIPYLIILSKTSKLDSFLGKLSYAIYVFHWPMSYLSGITSLLDSNRMETYLFTFLFSIVFIFLIENPVSVKREKWTTRVLKSLN